MRHASKHWRVQGGDLNAEARLQIELGTHPIVARLLVQRGLTTPEAAEAFLDPSLDRLHDPMLLPDAEVACERLKRALVGREKILVHGDYDGDGVTSAALWTRCLRALGADVDVFVPHRRRDGYDMRQPFIERAKRENVSLIITTDCGIQRVDEVESARQAGIDVIITDHHTPNGDGSLPLAIAVVNPHRSDSRYPFPHLAGVGVAFKLCEALVRYLGHRVDTYRRGFLDLAAIGTVTDVMPLTGENRILVKHGLEALQNTRKPGLQALIDSTGYRDTPIDTNMIGFQIGPRLNAASRVDETQLALDLLLTTDAMQARDLAERLGKLNAERRETQNRIFQEALAQVASMDMAETRCLVLHSTGWASGVIGIVAGKIVERVHRPCIVISVDEATGAGRGSARSIRAFNIYNAIDACRDLLTEYGGHAHAAGLAIEGTNMHDFASQMNQLARSLLSEEDCVPTLEVAQEIAPSEISSALLDQIAVLAPFGHGNEEPLFVSRDVPLMEVKRIGKENQHLRMQLRAEGLNGSDSVSAPWFYQGETADALRNYTALDVCYKPQFNTWNGRRSIQFLVSDVKPPQW